MEFTTDTSINIDMNDNWKARENEEHQYIKNCIESLRPDGVIEMRGLKGKYTASGYYTDRAEMAADAIRLEKAGYVVYFTINEINSALLARSANRTKENPKSTTSDNDITSRLYFYVDCDPNRPADISSSGEEKDAAVSRAYEIRDYLRSLGYPDPVIADSGNGAHLLYSIDLPKESDLVQRVLEGLAFKFSDEKVSIDTSVYNPARICKLYGTIANKGDHTGDRPHRRSGLLEVPDVIQPVDVELLKRVADLAPRPVEPVQGSVKLSQKFNIPAFLERHSIGVVREGQWRDGNRWVLEVCPWNGHTDNSAYIVQFGNGAIGAGCQHDSCQGEGWRELREHYEPGAYDKEDALVAEVVAHNALERVYVGRAITEGVEPPDELVERVLLKARVTSIYSGPGKGKTWLALWLILKVIEQGLPVLFFDSENGLSIVAERLESLGADPDDVDRYLHYYPHPALDLRQETVQTYQGLLNIKPALVVFDSWVNFLASAGLDENSSVDVEQWSVAYALSARNKDSAVLILDHVPKDGSGSRGSGRKKDMVDVQYSLTSLMPFDRDSVGSIALKREKDREGWLPWNINFDVGGDGAGGFKFEPTFETEDADENEEAALEVLGNAFPDGAKTVEWQKACYDLKGMSRATFYRVKKSLVPSRVELQGKIHRTKVSEVSEGLTKPDTDCPRGLRSTNPYIKRVGTRDSGDTKSDTPAGNDLVPKKDEGVLI